MFRGGFSPNIRWRSLERFVRPLLRSVRPRPLTGSSEELWHTARSSASESGLPEYKCQILEF
jgi:hypothetical protein